MLVMNEEHLGTAEAAHPLRHRAGGAFLYMTHVGPLTWSQCPLTNPEAQVTFLLLCQTIFQAGRAAARSEAETEATSVRGGLVPPSNSHMDF